VLLILNKFQPVGSIKFKKPEKKKTDAVLQDESSTLIQPTVIGELCDQLRLVSSFYGSGPACGILLNAPDSVKTVESRIWAEREMYANHCLGYRTEHDVQSKVTLYIRDCINALDLNLTIAEDFQVVQVQKLRTLRWHGKCSDSLGTEGVEPSFSSFSTGNICPIDGT
jgi:hypothetical protein